MTDILLTLADPDDRTFAELYRWLRTQRALTGLVTAMRREPGEEELGGALDVISVAVGSGGVGVALTGSLTAWIQSRRSAVTIKLGTGDQAFELHATNMNEVGPLLMEALRRLDDHGTS